MPTITLKNIPAVLHNELKKLALMHHRSLNGEILYRLEHQIYSQPLDIGSFLDTVRRLRKNISGKLTGKTLTELKNIGRL